MERKCLGKCKKILPLKEFYKDKHKSLGYSYRCKKCTKEYASLHKDRWKKQNKEWEEKNKEHSAQKHSEYRNKNRRKINKYIRQYTNNKYHSDIEFKIKCNLRSRFYTILKKSKIKKVVSCIKLLGCSLEEFKEYIKIKFKPEMTWDNHGKIWHIDHIVACSNFNLNKLEEQQKCFHYTNMQPLFATTRIAKSFGYDELGNINKNNK
jgi:hypothetical protein